MKKIFFIILSSISFTCFAGAYPTLSFNEPNCAAITKGNLTGCFQNKTDDNLGDYQFKQTLIYENGAAEESVFNLGAIQPGFFSVISTSSADLQNNKIASAWFSIIKGDAGKYQVMPGCSTEITPTAISKSVVSIFKVNGNVYCK